MTALHDNFRWIHLEETAECLANSLLAELRCRYFLISPAEVFLRLTADNRFDNARLIKVGSTVGFRVLCERECSLVVTINGNSFGILTMIL
jgi:hypothetical protein